VKTAANPEPFLTTQPKDIIRSGDFNRVPFVLGTNSEEGSFFLLRKFRVNHGAYMGAKYVLKCLCREISETSHSGRPGASWDNNWISEKKAVEFTILKYVCLNPF
jgi:carboxylesterase type B